jgi:hypothetical protein
MKKHLVSTLIAGVAFIALLAAVPAAQAGTTSDSISIHFAADEPTQTGGSMLDPSEVAGVVPSANWNNATTRGGVLSGLVRDTNGVATTTDATVLWEAWATFASHDKSAAENNSTFDPTTADYKVMLGYLDPQKGPVAGSTNDAPSPSIVVVTNLPANIASGTYDVYVYGLGGRSNRGGEYTVNGAGPLYLLAGGDTDQGPATGQNGYVLAKGTDPAFGADDFGNYLLFQGQTGSTITITGSNTFSGFDTHPRAPLNSIQIVVH